MAGTLLALRINFIASVLAVLTSQTGAALAKEADVKASTNAASATSASGPQDKSQRPFASPLRSVLGVGPALFFEDTDRVSERRVNGQRDGETEREGRVSEGFLALEAWYLFPWGLKQLRVGPGLAWYNAYTLGFPEDEDNNDDDLYHVGQTFQLFGQAEYVLLDVAGKMDFLLGLRAGGILVFAGRDLQDEIDRLEPLGYDFWPTPRAGVLISPQLGITWPLNDRLSLRSDIGIQFSKIWLYDAEAEASGSLIEVSSNLLTTRTKILLGLEFAL